MLQGPIPDLRDDGAVGRNQRIRRITAGPLRLKQERLQYVRGLPVHGLGIKQSGIGGSGRDRMHGFTWQGR